LDIILLKKSWSVGKYQEGFLQNHSNSLETLSQKLSKIDTNYLQLLSSFQEFISAKGEKTSKEEEVTTTSSKSSNELLEYSYQTKRHLG